MIKKKYSKSLCKVTFSFKKGALTGQEDVRVLGDFNDWQWENGIKLKFAKGEFSGSAELPLGRRYEFRYAANELFWFNDTQGDGYVSSPFYGMDNTVIFIESAPADNADKKSKGKKVTSGPKASAEEITETKASKSKKAKPKKSETKTNKKEEKAVTADAPVTEAPAMEEKAKGKPGRKPKAVAEAPAVEAK
ncbi:MAG: isoamylase early set domain-containing protein, partial [Ignavibacteriae bacterium]|nr:isoamylase early set domain-containing protein [Ignavibacteriota bacterium]